MHRITGLGKVILCLCAFFLSSVSFCLDGIAKIGRGTNVKLTLENKPQIGGIAILKLVVSDKYPLIKSDIGCFLPEGLELINDNNYEVRYKQAFSKEWGHSVMFYRGPLESDIQKEFVFKVYIPDGKKYLISASGGDNFDSIEIDLGDPEPPEWKNENKDKGRETYSNTKIKQIKKTNISELAIPQNTFPPLRTELKIRTRHKPHIEMPYNPQEIPLRYLVYTEIEAKEVEVTIELPSGLNLINEQDYEVDKINGSTVFKLFRGPMGFRECKVFYFKVRSDKKERFIVKAQTRILATDGSEFFTEDCRDIDLRKLRY